MISAEGSVIGLLFGLYLFDCLVLVFPGQAILERAAHRWRLAFGWKHYSVRGQPVVMLNPLTPWRATVKTLPLGETFAEEALRPSTALRRFRLMRLLAAAQLLLVLVMIPWLLLRNAGVPLLVSLLLAYLNAAAMVALAARGYARLGLRRRRLLGIAFGALVCLPLSINVFRHALLRLGLGGDASRWLRLSRGTERDLARLALLAYVSEAIDELDAGDAEHSRLQRLQRDLGDERV